ncbi:MAG TPA: protein kinase [Gemmatimonadaceae bacterium]
MSRETTATNTESPTTEERASQELLDRLRSATLGDYEILGELGRGGMATVFLAHEISLDRKVAIKVMNPAMVHGTGMVERFKREARTAANLSHPNIIPIFSVREVDGLLFCVIKLVQGTALDLIMRELGQLPIPMVHGILAQVGSALGYAHRHGVVHRDIKPGNILIDDEGWAVVTDFGIAKVADTEIRVTSTGMAIGTPVYMSPEQATADVVTGASDQYSLGIVAYEMLTGRTPFTGASMMQIMYSHFHDAPPPISDFRKDVPEQLCNAVMRMLRKSPEERWPSMEDAIAAAGARPLAPDDPTRSQLINLARTGHTHRLVVQTTTPRSPIPKIDRRRGRGPALTRHPVFLAGGAVALLGVGFLAAQMMSGQRRAAETPAPSPPVVSAAPDSGPAPASALPAVDRAKPPAVVSEPPRRTIDQPQRTGASAPTGRGAAGEPRPAVPDPSRDVTPRPESTVNAPVQKAESAVAPPVVAPPPMSTAANRSPETVTSIPRPPADPAAEVATVIQSYGKALGARDLAAARRIYPAMPNVQREGLEALWRAGGTMSPNWTVTDVAITGDVATARVTGSNVVVPGTGQTPTTVPVALRARLERRGGEWRLIALIN